ncbi:tropomyosin [Trichinella spiralis]|uniref:tropomyosin n=1 Tax=Trichinella spiralis TaxID=6334 RepID=UPI0001EFC3E1|nr:tropomyosin [Trichinella spiralis]
MKKKSENAVDAKQNADGMRLNNEREKVCAVYYMNNEEKKKRKHGRFVEQADHARHETDRGRHEAEQEKTKDVTKGQCCVNS